MKYYLDCEFDGHNGPLLSIALVRDDGISIHVQTDARAKDQWVLDNVMPHMEAHHATYTVHGPLNHVGMELGAFIGFDDTPVIVADSPVDIGRFCRAISTGVDGGWMSTDFLRMKFEVHNVDCYPTTLPGAVQHNAWWDAKALQHRLTTALGDPT